MKCNLGCLPMLYYVIRDTFDRDFEVLYGQYKIRSTDMFEGYYASGLS